jgi:hypothetical protein
MGYGTCRLCGEEHLLLRASHVIPSSLYRHMKPEAPQFGVIVWREGVVTTASLSPIEPIAADLLCGPCDNDLFGAWDCYSHHVLAERLPGARREGTTCVIEPIHYGRLKLFLWSVFWRAAVSGDVRFSTLADLPLAELQNRFLTADPGEPEFLPASVFVNDGPVEIWRALPLQNAFAVIAGRYAFVWGGPVILHRDRLDVSVVQSTVTGA